MRASRVVRMAANLMRSVVVKEFGGPEVLKIQSIPVPQCNDNQLLIKVKSVGINPVDTYIRQGTYTRLPPLPYTPGTDTSGVVDQVGSGVTDFKVGDRVFTARSTITGAYSEQCLVESGSCWKLPANISFQQGAAIGAPYFTAYRAIFLKCAAKATQTVLVHGASGAVGLAAVQLAKAHGLRVIGTASSTEGSNLVKSAGAEMVFNHKEEGYMQNILKTTGGIDIVLEMLSNVNLGHDLEIMRPHGSVAVIGCRGSVEINPRLMMGKESKIIGVALMTSSPEEWSEMGDAIVSMLEDGKLSPVVGKEYKLEEAQQAHQDIIHNSGAAGKLVFTI